MHICRFFTYNHALYHANTFLYTVYCFKFDPHSNFSIKSDVTRATTDRSQCDAKELKEIKDRSVGRGKSTPCVLWDCRTTVICCSPLEDDCTPSWWIIHQSSTYRNHASSAIGLPSNVSQNVSINPPLPSLPALLALLSLFLLQNRRLLASLNLKQHFISINYGFIVYIFIIAVQIW